MGIGNANLQLNLMDVANWDEIVAMVEEAAAEAEPGELIRGRGWHQEKWDRIPDPNVDGLPFHQALSAVSPDNPVVLTHASGHATYANAKAMDLPMPRRQPVTRATFPSSLKRSSTLMIGLCLSGISILPRLHAEQPRPHQSKKNHPHRLADRLGGPRGPLDRPKILVPAETPTLYISQRPSRDEAIPGPPYSLSH